MPNLELSPLITYAINPYIFKFPNFVYHQVLWMTTTLLMVKDKQTYGKVITEFMNWFASDELALLLVPAEPCPPSAEEEY